MKSQPKQSLELIFEVAGEGSLESVFRKTDADGNSRFVVNYSHTGINEEDEFWTEGGNEYDSWNEYWEEFSEMDDWWYYLKPVKIHPDYHQNVIEALQEIKENMDMKTDSGNFFNWQESCRRSF